MNLSTESIAIANASCVGDDTLDGIRAEDAITISYQDAISAAVADELDTLYQHLNSSLCHYALKRRAQHAHVYVARRGGAPLAILPLVHDGQTVRVLNEMVLIPGAEVDRFAGYMFGRFPKVARICFSLIGADVGTLRWPHQQHGHSEDIVVPLPDAPEAYLSSLGAKTRQTIKNRLKALARDHPDLLFTTSEGASIDPRAIDELMALKQSNTDDKRIDFGIAPDESAWLAERARINGLLTLAVRGGRICGGSLSSRLGDHYFAHVLAFDRTYARYSLGILCAYRAICENIARGARETHLGWGCNPYKFNLGGVQRDMRSLDLYRSRAAVARYGGRIAMNAVATLLQQGKTALLAQEKAAGPRAFLARGIVRTARALKRSRFEPASAPGHDP
jgi:hypothetical protein